ncbi:methyl-accepting chemotaxis protein [Pelagicoccus sp. SDUM812003]|uniref:methyl-accepting chemotaxis protein n=1 Tax=Pelagicoccus sp. SDUM812003 TaxID=3041267 RepID=UPI00280DFE3B|nr:methyl-accepting chemotaxis protein [Pelagicoccus sp. SDUM812003]MDQ8203887.1 methyl-accepting chemotaxis protein [Pelagicoccus sp. SDUM812003]
MKLQRKLILYLSTASILAMLIGVFVQKLVIDDVEVDRTRDAMRSTLIQAETVRANASRLVSRNAYDYESLQRELETAKDVRETAFYSSIPVVASWQSIEKVAEEFGYSFRISKTDARNPDNEPTARELTVLDYLKRNDADEYFFDDKEADQLVYARPIRLTRDCLYCHGDPDRSPTGDGLDVLGFAMEGWQEGEMHGAFILKADKKNLRAMGTAAFLGGAGRTAMWTIPPVIALVAVFAFILRKSVFGPMRRYLKRVSGTAERNLQSARGIHATSASLSDGVNQQVASIEETGATLEEISSMSRASSDRASAVQKAVSKTGDAVRAGSGRISEMQGAINAINESSQRIGVINKTIEEIAFQTNLLALNAAVEAARAGEAGAGFAVVADEVRGLAMRCAEAAKTSEGLIQDSLSKSEAGVQVTTDVVAYLRQIESEMAEVETSIDEITESAAQQSVGVEQINAAMRSMETVSQESAASSEELADSASSLTEQARQTRLLISTLEELVFGGEIRRSEGAASSVEYERLPRGGARPSLSNSRLARIGANEELWKNG